METGGILAESIDLSKSAVQAAALELLRCRELATVSESGRCRSAKSRSAPLAKMPTPRRIAPCRMSTTGNTSDAQRSDSAGVSSDPLVNDRAYIWPNRMPILLKNEIQSLGIIQLPRGDAPDPDCLGPSSYDLRLGSEFFMPPINERGRNKPAQIDDCSKTGPLEIPAFSAVLLSTYETVKMPLHVTGRWDLKIRWAMAGLIFQMGTQIEPGYEGRLFGLLYNLSDSMRTIRYKDRLWCVEFLEMHEDADVPPEKRIPRLKMREFLTIGKPTGSINKLYQQSDKTLREIQKVAHFKWSLLLIIITMGLAIILPLLITKFTYDKDDQPLTHVMGLQKSVEDLRAERDSQMRRMESLIDSADKRSAETEKRFHDMADAQRQEWVRQPTLYYVERLQYLRHQRDELRAVSPNSAELKKIEQEIADIATKLTEMPSK